MLDWIGIVPRVAAGLCNGPLQGMQLFVHSVGARPDTMLGPAIVPAVGDGEGHVAKMNQRNQYFNRSYRPID